MNNKGFAITGILYTLFILFIMILFSILSSLSYKKGILEKTVLGIEDDYETEIFPGNINNTYKEAEKDLQDGKMVLYSGTPCQIAGLKCYLKNDYENLYTVDIICHGTPSQKIWEKYAKYLEKKEKSKIVHVVVRYNNTKEPGKNFHIKYENGKETYEVLYDTSYGRAFLVGLINDNCCNECNFNDFKQYSDITLGDAWGYKNKKYPNKNSLILLNTEKGKKLYKSISKKLIEFNDYNLENMIREGYPIIHSTFSHYNNGKININAKNIDEELWRCLDEKNGLTKDKNGFRFFDFIISTLLQYNFFKIILYKYGFSKFLVSVCLSVCKKQA